MPQDETDQVQFKLNTGIKAQVILFSRMRKNKFQQVPTIKSLNYLNNDVRLCTKWQCQAKNKNIHNVISLLLFENDI